MAFEIFRILGENGFGSVFGGVVCLLLLLLLLFLLLLIIEGLFVFEFRFNQIPKLNIPHVLGNGGPFAE